MSKLERGILKYYIDGKFFQRIEEAKTPEELDSIYNELNADWEKEVVPISQDILDLFVYNKHIGKELFKKIIYKFRFNGRLDFFKEIYQDLKEYEFIEFDDLFDRFFEPTISDMYFIFLDYLIEENMNMSEGLKFVTRAPQTCQYTEERITYFWGRRNEIEDNEQKKLFVKKILLQQNVSKEILFQAYDEFKNDIDIVVEVFVNGIEYPEIFSKVLETLDKDVILEKIKSNLNSTDADELLSYIYPDEVHIIMSVARIADDNKIKRILNLLKKYKFSFSNKKIFNSQDEQEILEEPMILESRYYSNMFYKYYSDALNKIMLSMSKNPNASLDTLKYIVQSTNDIETLYYCIVNSGRNLEIFELINKKGLSPVQEDLKNNEVLAYFNDEMKEWHEYILVSRAIEEAIHTFRLSMQGFETNWIEGYIGRKDLKPEYNLWDIRGKVYETIAASLNTKVYGDKVGELMDKIREQLKNLSFERISLGIYSPDNFPDLQSKEQAYFECLVNYGLVNDNDVRKFLETCLGEKYLKRYERDIALFSERGLDLAQTSKGAPQRGGF